MAIMITDMVVGTTISIVLVTGAKHSAFFPGLFKKWQNIGDGCTSGQADCKGDKPCSEDTIGHTPDFIVGYQEC